METTTQIADRLVELLNQLQFVEAYLELFHPDAESIDPIYADQPPLKGLDLLINREKQFLQNAQINSIKLSDHIVAGNYFTISITMDFVVAGTRKVLAELCVYKVTDEKIIMQQFFIG